MIRAACLLLRILLDALDPPPRRCPHCTAHIALNRELARRLADTLDAPPVRPLVGLWVVGDRATPPAGLPVLPGAAAPGWASLYEADDPDCLTVDV